MTTQPHPVPDLKFNDEQLIQLTESLQSYYLWQAASFMVEVADDHNPSKHFSFMIGENEFKGVIERATPNGFGSDSHSELVVTISFGSLKGTLQEFGLVPEFSDPYGTYAVNIRVRTITSMSGRFISSAKAIEPITDW